MTDEAAEPRAREDANAALGRHLRALRKQRGWTQITLSEKSGVSLATIRSVEGNHAHGRRRLHGTLAALSRGLGLSNDYLLNYYAMPPSEDIRQATDAEVPAPERPLLDVLAQAVQEIMVLLNETVLPRMDRMETLLDMLVDRSLPRNPHRQKPAAE